MDDTSFLNRPPLVSLTGKVKIVFEDSYIDISKLLDISHLVNSYGLLYFLT